MLQTSNCSLLLTHLPRKDERLSQPGWLMYSGRFTHISGHLTAVGRAQYRESSLVTERRSTNCATQPTRWSWNKLNRMEKLNQIERNENIFPYWNPLGNTRELWCADSTIDCTIWPDRNYLEQYSALKTGWPLVWKTWKCPGIWQLSGKCQGFY